MFAPDVHAQKLVAQDRVDSLAAAAASRDGVTDPINRVERADACVEAAEDCGSRPRSTPAPELGSEDIAGAVHPPRLRTPQRQQDST